MKYLLLIAILVVAYMIWRNNQLLEQDERARAPRQAAGKPQDMVCCPVCSVHLPRSDAVAGAKGVFYCSQEHRQRGGG
ncbi:hypothetical protein HHL11_04530 [Ramlibacter sp. G-1-2-2]|uniref:Preprotein translocase subunit YajC n=1 Tax=Ramlibacter agri TaxID=2728837 RepID=A0A848GWH8_9BURK|nr:PP0621 family protein [Ramlibacter agri]NML43006.1 hypothetical protein [Ramlibacter agri]